MTIAKLCSVCLYLLLTVITVWMARQVTIEQKQPGRRYALQKSYVIGIFLVLFACSALRFDVGNDYQQYTYTAHEAYVGGYVVTEAGFNYLVKLVYGLFGGEYYEIVFALFAFVTLFFFLKAIYEQSIDFGFSFFLFMTLGFYFQTFNTVRYYLALAIALYSLRYVLEKDWIRFVLWIVIAAFFHKSVLLVIPVYFLVSFIWKKSYIFAVFLFSAACFLLKGPVLHLALKLYPSYKDTVYLNTQISYTSIFRILAVVCFYLWFCCRYKEESNDKELRLYGQLQLLALDVSVFFSFLPVVTRVVYYFSVTQLFLLPMLIARIPEEKVRKRAKILVIIACVIYFGIFLYCADKPGVALLPYKTWVFEESRFVYK